MSRRSNSLLAAIVFLLLAFGCQPGGQKSDAPGAQAQNGNPDRPKKTLIVASSRDHQIMGHFNDAATDSEVSDIVYAGLARKNALTLEDDPWLAEALPATDRGTWSINADGTMVTTYRLRPNTKWHDGIALTSRDIAFGWELALDPKTQFSEPSVAQAINQIDTPDDRTLVLHWKETYRRANAVYRNRLSPVPRHLLEADYRSQGGEVIPNHPYWTTAFVGDGPYRIASWDQGRELELEAFDDYFLGRPKIDRVVWRFILDVNAVLANVLTNSVDVVLREAYTFDTALVAKEQWEAQGKGTVIFAPVTIQWVNLTPLNPWLADPRVRQAMLYAIDRQEVVETLSRGLEPVAHIPLPPKRPQYERALAASTTYEYNPQRARQLMAEAGWAPAADGTLVNGRGERFVLDGRSIRNDTMQLQAATVDYWKRLGVETQINNMSARQEAGDEFRGRWTGARWTAASVSVESWVNRFGSANIPTAENRWNGANDSRWDDSTKESVLQELEQTLDPRRADDLIVEFSRLYAAQLPDLPLRFLAEIMSVREGVVNLYPRSELGGQNTRTWNAEQWDLL